MPFCDNETNQQLMKYKNYSSAIHNFSHSFVSIDYLKSGRLAVNVLIDLLNKNLETSTSFDFINKTINPIEAISKESLELLNDYYNWLPSHFDSHNCDLKKLEKLEVTILIDFGKSFVPKGMNNCIQFDVLCFTKWKANKEEHEIVIKQSEVIKSNYLKLRIPEYI